MILRISRTYPRKKQQGIGLHCYYYTKYIKLPTVIFTKKINDQITDLPQNASVYEINYRDIKFDKLNENYFKLILIIFTKIYGELIYFYKIFFFIFNHRKKIKLIHLHSANYLLCAFLLKIIFNIPLVVNFGGTDLKRILKFFILKKIVKRVDAILYVSSHMKKDLDSFCPNTKKYYIGNGVDTDFFIPTNNKNNFNILSIGNFRWQKGYKYLFEAIKNIKEAIPKLKLFIAGGGDEIESYKLLARKLNIDSYVEFLGSISRIEIKNYLHNSHVYVSSSVSEGFPKALIESIACGIPVVVTDVGQSKKIVSNKLGIVVPPNNSLALANALKKILLNNELKKEYRNNCINSRKQFSWKNVISIVEKCYSEI